MTLKIFLVLLLFSPVKFTDSFYNVCLFVCLFESIILFTAEANIISSHRGTGFGWVSFLHSGLYGSMFWIGDQKSVDSKRMF